MTDPRTPLWRQAYDAAERRVTPHADSFVRTPTFAVGAALVRRAGAAARDSVQGLSARAWHLLNLPAGSDVHRLRAQVGALDREIRRLTLHLEAERTRTPEETDADPARPSDGPRPGTPRRRAPRPPRP